MKAENEKAMESLSLFCHIGGLVIILLGVIVIFMNLIDQDFKNIQAGIFILVSGYSFTKISQRLTQILFDEKNKQSEHFSFKK